MATYLKRTSSKFDLSLSRLSADVNLRDLMCPVCRGILIEPVTLPCTHNLCLRCLKGTFEHNSLSCPLCRLRVGSWLRTATKSETLVNHGLWELIKTKFPKEVEDKHNGEEQNLGLMDADFAANRIFSAAGEIHREYEAQLQMAEEEMRRQRQMEQMASEALIQKIQAQEQQQLLAQLAQDQLLAKTIAKKQVTEKKKEAVKCYSECLSTSNYSCNTSKFNVKAPHVNNVEVPHTETAHLESRRMILPESVGNGSEMRRTNMTLLSKIRAERYAKIKTNALNMYKDCCPKQLGVHNAVTKTLKHQAISKLIPPCTSNYSVDPGCSTSRAYITETKEELRVPSDVVNRKKKSLEIEVCTTHGSVSSHRTNDDERIGSAESSGSHDSINQEIHHFKPIKTVPRTSLKISSDGKQIDPKLIRVIPIVGKVINAVLKPPSPTHMKRIVGCSWSAFRGKARQDAKEKQITHNTVDTDTVTLINQKPSTSLNHSQIVSNKSVKHQTSDVRVDIVPEPSFDDNKNYTKNANKIVNGTKLNKKLLEDESDVIKTRKSWRTRIVRNGAVAKSKRHRNAWSGKKGRTRIASSDAKDERENDSRGSCSPLDKTNSQSDEWDDDDDVTVENIAERIKKRKVNIEKRTKPETESDTMFRKNNKKGGKKRVLSERRDESPETADQTSVLSSRESAKLSGKSVSRTKRQRKCGGSNTESLGRNEQSQDATSSKAMMVTSKLKRSARNPNLTKISLSKGDSNESDGTRDRYSGDKFNYESPPESCDETDECVSVESIAGGSRVDCKHNLSDEEVIEEQQRIERLLLQEQEDFELARRLQAKFDDMERIAGRTRRSRKAVEGANIDTVDLPEIGTTRTVRKTSGAPRPVERSIAIKTARTVPKKRGRPPKRVKKEMRAR